MRYLNFQWMSVKVQNMKDIGKVSMSLGENPASWQVSFISPTFYPPGIIIDVLGLPFVVTTVSRQTANIFQYQAYLEPALKEMSAMGKIDNTGVYKRVEDTNPYQWERLADLTAAIQNVARSKSQNTLLTPFERSFDRFDSSGMKWSFPSIRDAVSNLYISSQTLVIPYYSPGSDKIEWVSPQSWPQTTVDFDDMIVSQLNILGKPKGIKIFVKNRYKKAVTLFECPMKLNPDHEYIDVGFYVMACDGNPTVRLTHNYNVGFNFVTRVQEDENVKDDSGMVYYDEEGKPTYWYENVQVNPNQENIDEKSLQTLNNLAQLYLKALVFVSNPIITFDSQNDYLDSYFPYPISPWNFQVYFKPNNIGKWIPSGEPYPVYDLNLINNLPQEEIWTGAFCSVTRISTLQQTDEALNKEIVQQGFYVNGFNVGNTINPYSLLTVENQTQMPVIAETTVNEYLGTLQMPQIPYYAYMISGLQRMLYQYGLTIEQVTDNKDVYPSKVLELDIETMEVKIEGQTIQTSTMSIGPATVIICYEMQESANGRKYTQLASEYNVGVIKIKSPTNTQRMEKYVIIVFSTAIYFITYRVFASKPFLCMPYVYKFDELWNQTLTSDYDIVSLDNYSNLVSRIGRLVDKSVVVEWEGRTDECTPFPFIPYHFINVNGGKYVITNVNATIDGEYVKVTVTADNRHILYQRWSKITTDITPDKCDYEITQRIPNRHYPPSKIYAYSDRNAKIQQYIQSIFKYTY